MTSRRSSRAAAGSGAAQRPPAVDDVDLAVVPGRDARDRRRVGLGQIDAAAHDPAPAPPDLGPDPLSRAAISARSAARELRALRRRMQASSRTRLPRSIRARRSARFCRRRSRCTASEPEPERGAWSARPWSWSAWRRLRRTAIPHQLSGGQRQRVGDRARHHPEARAGPRRRADLGARRLGAGADPEPFPSIRSASSA